MLEKPVRVFELATQLYRVAFSTAEKALLRAGDYGVSSSDLFELCQDACKKKVPVLDYDGDNFRTTIQDIFEKHLDFYISGDRLHIPAAHKRH